MRWALPRGWGGWLALVPLVLSCRGEEQEAASPPPPQLAVPEVAAVGERIALPCTTAPLVVPVGLTGTWQDPAIQLDTGAMASAAQSRATARVKQQADQVKQKVTEQVTGQVTDRATKALGGLFGQPADSAAAAADTTQALPGVGDEIKSILKDLRGGKGK